MCWHFKGGFLINVCTNLFAVYLDKNAIRYGVNHSHMDP